MKDIKELLKKLGVKKVKIISMTELTLVANKRKYTLTIETDCIKIRDKSIIYTFNKDSNIINLIEDFLSM